MANVRGLSDLHRDMEIASTEATSLLPTSLRSTSGKQVADLVFPGISWSKSIVWITLAQIVVYTACCIVGSNYLQPTDQTLLLFGGLSGQLVKAGQIWRLILPIFLHSGFGHILVNLLLILHMSLNIETRYGMAKFLFLYFGSGVLGNIMTVAIHPCDLSVGASTAGFGIIGCLLCELALTWNNLSQTASWHSSLSLVVFFVLVLLTGFIPSVDLYGHIGGFVGGVVITMYYQQSFDHLPKWYNYVLGVASLAAIAILVAMPLRIWAISMQC